MMTRKVKKLNFHYDYTLIIIVLCLLSFGLLMVGSASMVISDKIYNYPFHYLLRQAVFILVGIFGAWVATRIPLRIWERSSRHLMLVGLFFLLLVLIPGIGHLVNGSRRWLNLGVVSLQVSEFVKLASILYVSSYLSRYSNAIRDSLWAFVKPMLVLMLAGVLLLLEPDFGALTVITIIFLALLFVAGARLLPFSLMLVLVLGVMVSLAVLTPYRLLRVTTFLHPWSHAYSSGYQLTQSLIAFGRGGVLGVGLGNSVQKLHYLPEAHSDFIFAVIAEELGLVGEIVLIMLFVFLVSKLIFLARQARNSNRLFAQYVSFGVAVWLSVQALINIGVTTGVLPTKGLTLPFISYGGSSILVSCIAVGILLRVAYELTWSSDGENISPYSR
jgi:cell division protein FtsW